MLPTTIQGLRTPDAANEMDQDSWCKGMGALHVPRGRSSWRCRRRLSMAVPMSTSSVAGADLWCRPMCRVYRPTTRHEAARARRSRKLERETTSNLRYINEGTREEKHKALLESKTQKEHLCIGNYLILWPVCFELAPHLSFPKLSSIKATCIYKTYLIFVTDTTDGVCVKKQCQRHYRPRCWLLWRVILVW